MRYFLSNNDVSPSCSSIIKEGAAFSGCASFQSTAHASSSLCREGCLPESRDYVCLSRFIVTIWIIHLGLFGGVLFVFCSPEELKTRVGPGIFTAALSQSLWLWTAWSNPWLAHLPGLLLCTRCSAWMTAVASHHHGNSLHPSQRGTLPRGWVPPMRLWAPAYGPQPRNHRLKVSHREGGNGLVGLLMC